MSTAKDIESHPNGEVTTAQIEAARAHGLDVGDDGKIGNVAGRGQLATDAYVPRLMFSLRHSLSWSAKHFP